MAATPLETLTLAFELLQDGGVCRDAYARNSAGERVPTHHEDATSWCVVGAIARASFLLEGDFVSDLSGSFQLLSPYVDEGKLTYWNDDAEDAEVLGVVRSSINAERSRIAERIHSTVL